MARSLLTTSSLRNVHFRMDRFCPFLLEMGPGMFMAHVTMMMGRRNALVVSKRIRGIGENKLVSCGKAYSTANRILGYEIQTKWFLSLLFRRRPLHACQCPL